MASEVVVLGGSQQHNARDSLSLKGIWNEFGDTDVMKYLAFVDQHRAEDDVPYQIVSVEQQQVQTGRSKNNESLVHGVTFPLPPTSTTQSTLPCASPPTEMEVSACEPRSFISRRRRPYDLQLEGSRGATSLSTADLRSLIHSTKSSDRISHTSRIQVIHHESPPSPEAFKGRKKYRQAPIYGATVTVHLSPAPEQQRHPAMGNQQSHHGTHESFHTVGGAQYSSSEETESSVDSVIGYSRPRANKSSSRLASIGVLKKKVTRDPNHRFTATVIEVPRAVTAPNLDLVEDGLPELKDDGQPDQASHRARHGKTVSEPSPAFLSHPGSPDTVTEESAARPLSAGTTITGHSITCGTSDSLDDLEPGTGTSRIAALSPTIPTPSPIPEDSPHQYGLKDLSDTPSPQPAVDETKAKRRSNGVEMFNVSTTIKLAGYRVLTKVKQDARSLQTAASFLNGLSNARRRAESRAELRARQRDVSKSNDNPNLMTASTTSLVCSDQQQDVAFDHAYRSATNLHTGNPTSPDSSPPLTPRLDNVSRTLGHSHKSSGFLYAKALSVVQLQCYRNHERLLRSGNTNCPIECAVCHDDAAGDYFWSCSWCALRMCGGCRNDFRQQGIKALRDKIRSAELCAVSGG